MNKYDKKINWKINKNDRYNALMKKEHEQNDRYVQY